MRKTATISKALHYVRIFDYHEEFAEKVIRPFCRLHFYQTSMKPDPITRTLQRKIDHIFARSNHDKTEYRFTVSLFKQFMEFVQYRGYDPARVMVLEEPIIEPVKVKFEFNPGFEKPRDENQEDWIGYMLDDSQGNGYLKVNNDNTGGGKGYMAIHAMVKRGYRTLITMQPRYIPIWKNELNKFIKMETEDLVVWEHSLPKLAEALRKGIINPKVLILPMSRVEPFLRKKEIPDPVDLDDIIKLLRPGLRIIEEAHEAVHQVYSALMYGNVKHTVPLSATLRADDTFVNRVYEWMYPIPIRFKEADPQHYIDTIALLYKINVRKYKIKWERYGMYDDKVFEESILANKVVFDFYFELWDKAFQEWYVSRREEGTKALFFFSRKEMCKEMQRKFLERYPGWDMETFLASEEKDKEKYKKHEILFTTQGSCGTGKDIPGLIAVFCSHTVNSTQTNGQMIGRLRELFKLFGGLLEPIFVFGVCVDIDKHLACMEKRKTAFAKKMKRFRRMNLECALE